MKTAEKIHKLIKKFLEIKKSSAVMPVEKDKQILNDILAAYAKSKMNILAEYEPNVWRIIMKSKLTKLAVAAVVVLVATLGIIFLKQTTAPAWAIEQTIEALSNIRGVHMTGTLYNPWHQERTDFEILARPSSKDPNITGDLRFREGAYHYAIVSEKDNLTYLYDSYNKPKVDVVYITEGLNRRSHTFAGADKLEELKRKAPDWTEEYRQDPKTGRDSVYIKFTGFPLNSAPYWQLQIDLETKLPVSAAVWLDSGRQGKPHFEYENIQFDPVIPEDSFKFLIPQNSQVIDCRVIRKHIEQMPGAGISIEGLSNADACKKVVQAYWQAVISQDWNTAKNLRPLASEDLANIYMNNPPAELKDVPENIAYLGDRAALPQVVCVLKMKNGNEQKSMLNVAFHDTPNGKIGVIAGSVGPEFYD